MFITFILMFGLAAIAEPMILTLIGEKWRPAIIYLQMLCFVGMFYPLHALNLNMLYVQGRSDLFLRLEIFKKILAIPTIIAGIFWGIKVMIIGMMINTIIAYYLNSYYSGRMIGYPIHEQIRDISPSFLLALCVSAAVFLSGQLFGTISAVSLAVQVGIGAVLTVLFGELLRLKDYLYVKSLLYEKFLGNSSLRAGA